jgi:hypothetical protein
MSRSPGCWNERTGRDSVTLEFAGIEPAAIFVSGDGGQSWQEQPGGRLRKEHGWYLPYSPEAGCVWSSAFHGSRIYAAVEQGGLLRSDLGRTLKWSGVGYATWNDRLATDFT